MMKFALLAGAMTIAAPALAQVAPQAQPGTAPVTETAPAAPATANDPAATTAQTAPQAAPGADPAAQTATAAAEPAATGDQVAAVVTQEFPTYDKDSNGSLSKTEFASWMVTLKQASDPSAKADSAATKSWVGSAFAQADTDKSKSVSKDELTGFLSKAAG